MRRLIDSNYDKNTIVLLHFNENLGDSSTYYNGKYITGSASYVEGKFDKALSAGNRYEITYAASVIDTLLLGSKDCTIDFWINPLNTSEINIFESDRTHGILYYINQWSSSGLVFSPKHDGDTNTLITNKYLTPNEFNHVAVVKIGYNYTMYLNGVKIGQKTLSPTYNITAIPGLGFTSATSRKYIIDEFRVSDIARYDSNFEVPTKPY